MITLPDDVVPNSATPHYIDFGGIITPATGGEDQLLLRNGNRWQMDLTFAPETAEARRVALARVVAAKRDKLRVPYPLQGVNQTGGGALVVDGANQTGGAIALRGGTPGFVIKEGWWMSLQRADARHYLHQVRGADATIASDGKVILGLSPNLRFAFSDGAVAHLTKPMIEGAIVGDISWSLRVGGLIEGLGFTLREVA